jgi:peptide/nickel transport system permease protein
VTRPRAARAAGDPGQRRERQPALRLRPPLHEQYFTYVGALLRGDFGSSTQTGQPVVELFKNGFPATAELALLALAFAVSSGIPLGYFAARRHGTALDSLTVGRVAARRDDPGVLPGVPAQAGLRHRHRPAGLPRRLPDVGPAERPIGATHPTGFYILDGLLTREWDAAWDALVHLVLPAVALGTIPLAIIVRITRAAVLDVTGEDFVRTAEAKGLTQRTISRRHVLRNALLPVVTTVGLQAGLLLSGAVLTESVFAINGLGSKLFSAITLLDYPVLQGFILAIALMYALINLTVDVLYGVIDPRVRVS